MEKKTMKKTALILGAALCIWFAGTAHAITVDGNFGLVEWAGSYSAENYVGSGGYVGPGWGGQAFDVEYLGLQFTSGGKLYFGLQTGFDVINGVDVSGHHYAPGDFALNVNGDSAYDYAIHFDFAGSTPTYSLYQVSSWNSTEYFSAGNPFTMASGTLQSATFEAAYGTTIDTVNNGPSYILEGSLDLSDLALYSGGPITLHWTMSCGNDYLNHTSSPSNVPEPSTLVLLGSGLTMASAWGFWRKRAPKAGSKEKS